MKVHGGKFSFHGTFDSGSVTFKATVSGQFGRHNMATGSIKETRTADSDPSVHCTGQELWKAHKR
jgi:hypothetical protein